MVTESSTPIKIKFRIMVRVDMESPQTAFPTHRILFSLPPSYPAIPTIEFSAVAFKHPKKNTNIIQM